MSNVVEKLAYETPVVRAHGSIETITHGASDGNALDATFPSGTPKGELTFS